MVPGDRVSALFLYTCGHCRARDAGLPAILVWVVGRVQGPFFWDSGRRQGAPRACGRARSHAEGMSRSLDSTRQPLPISLPVFPKRGCHLEVPPPPEHRPLPRDLRLLSCLHCQCVDARRDDLQFLHCIPGQKPLAIRQSHLGTISVGDAHLVSRYSKLSADSNSCMNMVSFTEI
jgi:hypothetical protein